MKYLKPLTTDFRGMFNKITIKKDDWINSIPILEKERKEFVANCISNKPFLQKVFDCNTNISEGITGKDCINKYGSIRSSKKSDLAKLTNSNYFCAYCGTTIARTVDHFLPKSSYAQLALCLENMVPCCDWCNRKKSKYTANSDSELLFNPNFNNFLSYDWINIRSVCINRMITFSSFFNEDDKNLSNNQKTMIKNTISKLDILKCFDALLDSIYREDFFEDDIYKFINDNIFLSKTKEIYLRYVEKSYLDSLSERNFLRYRLLCYFETKEFKKNFLSVYKY